MTQPIQGPVHLVGIGGMHMSAIALLLREQGITVTGSDLRPSPLTARVAAHGATVFEGHREGQVGDARLVVTTAAADDSNPEIAEARRRGIPVILRAEMVARLMEGKRVVAVAGSHGKTTTSSLIAHILTQAGHNPMYLLGGESIDLGGHAAWGDDICVVEADEYKRAFHEYRPEVAVITNVEADHLDYYGTAEAYDEAFAQFAQRVVPGGRLLWCGDDDGAAAVIAMTDLPDISSESYGIVAGDWQALDVVNATDGATFTVARKGEALGQVHTNVPGDHFVRNTLAATAVVTGFDVPFDEVARAVASFQGAKRRFERVGEAAGVLVMDDYAHHPTEVRATIAAARGRFADRRLIGIYQPHTYSRIAYLWDEWLQCWDGLDELIVLETYAAREQPEAGRSAADLAQAIPNLPASYASTFEEAAEMAAARARPGDVVFTIGAGDVNAVGPLLLEALR